MLRAIYKDRNSGELTIRGDVLYAYIFHSEYDGLCVCVNYGKGNTDFVRIPVEDKMKAEGILRGATISGLLDFTV